MKKNKYIIKKIETTYVEHSIFKMTFTMLEIICRICL